MAKYQFESILRTFEKTFSDLKDTNPDEDAQKFHDIKVLQSIVPSFREVQAFYKNYEKTILEAKKQSKSNMDAIENTIKKCKGKPSPVEMKLLEQSREQIERWKKVLEGLDEELRKELMDWRGGWPAVCASVLFRTTHLEPMKNYRKEVIDRQAAEWNPAVERVNQYVLRAQTLLAAVAKASNQAPEPGGAGELDRLTKAHEACMAVGTKGVRSLMDNVENNAPKIKSEAKKGLEKGMDKKKAIAELAVKGPKFDQYTSYAKSFSGALKTLEMLLKSVSSGLKAAGKGSDAPWKKLKADIEADVKALEVSQKYCDECIKYGEVVRGQYQKVIDGK